MTDVQLQILQMIANGRNRMRFIRPKVYWTERTIQRHLKTLREQELIRKLRSDEVGGPVYCLTAKGIEHLVRA